MTARGWGWPCWRAPTIHERLACSDACRTNPDGIGGDVRPFLQRDGFTSGTRARVMLTS